MEGVCRDQAAPGTATRPVPEPGHIVLGSLLGLWQSQDLATKWVQGGKEDGAFRAVIT